MFDLLKRGKKAEADVSMSLLVKIALAVLLFLALSGMIWWVSRRFMAY